jgi:Ser/Thr protein kinase RdoA (MazF antagonist)
MSEQQTLSDYARLDPELVIAAVESAGYQSDARVFPLNSYENRVYQVGIEDSTPLIAKFYRPARWSHAQLQEEHDFTLQLAAAELPVVAPIANAAGQTLHTYNDYRFALFPRKGGQAPEPGDLDQLHRIGMLLGRLHAVGRQQPFAERPALNMARFLDTPAAFILAGGFLPSDLQDNYRRIIETLRAAIVASGIEQAALLRTQGDCHPGNIIWTRDDGPWLLDFDDCQTAPAVQDMWMLLTGFRSEQEVQMSELLDGYTAFNDFDVRELRLIEALRSLRMIHYAGWLASRWEDPAFPRYFPWFNTPAYWREHLAELTEQITLLNEEPLRAL